MNTNDMPSSRAAAKLAGSKHYFTGKPCSRGHVTLRHLTGTCIECQQIANRAWAARNPDEAAKRSAKWQRDNPERVRVKNRLWRRKKMGIPNAPYTAPLNCENCQKPFKNGFDTHLDHDHKTGKFRGWLCNKCNRGFGYFNDSVEGIQRAIEYLKRAEAGLKTTP